MLRIICIILPFLAACHQPPTPQHRILGWDPTTKNCDGKAITGAVTYNVYGVHSGDIPTKVVNGACGPVKIPTIAPLNPSPLTTNSFRVPTGVWVLGVVAINKGNPSGLSEPFAVTSP